MENSSVNFKDTSKSEELLSKPLPKEFELQDSYTIHRGWWQVHSKNLYRRR
jgi:hypothetical protein